MTCKQEVLQISMYDLSSIQQSIENSKNILIKMKPASYPFQVKIGFQRREWVPGKLLYCFVQRWTCLGLSRTTV